MSTSGWSIYQLQLLISKSNAAGTTQTEMEGIREELLKVKNDISTIDNFHDQAGKINEKARSMIARPGTDIGGGNASPLDGRGKHNVQIGFNNAA